MKLEISEEEYVQLARRRLPVSTNTTYWLDTSAITGSAEPEQLKVEKPQRRRLAKSATILGPSTLPPLKVYGKGTKLRLVVDVLKEHVSVPMPRSEITELVDSVVGDKLKPSTTSSILSKLTAARYLVAL
jgi:hypothetical protein